MKRIIVVNDCAYVMQDLIPLLSDSFDIEFLTRTRSLYSKSLGIFFKILGSKGDLFHVNYALQDAYFVQKLKRRLDVLHVHGSDVRTTINSKWGWIVKSNMKSAGKVLYATPDLEKAVKQHRPDATYLPTPVRTDIFTEKVDYSTELKALYFKLSYESLPVQLEQILARNKISLKVLDRNIPYPEMPTTMKKFDIFIDRFSIPSLSKTCLEAMSCGLATIDYRHKEDLAKRVEFLADRKKVKEVGEENRRFVIENHEASKIAAKLAEIWDDFN